MNVNCPYLDIQCNDMKCDCAKYLAYVDAKNPKVFNRILKEYGFDINKSDFDLICDMQYSYASRTKQIEKLTREEKEKWIDRYLVCIEDEIREVREYLNLYDEVEKKDKDIELKKEVIDILHFVTELLLVCGFNHDVLRKYYFDYIKFSNYEDDIIHVAYSFQKNFIDKYLNTKKDISKDITILKACCKLSDACALVRQQISWKYWKKKSLYTNWEKLDYACTVVFYEFINLCILTMSVNEIKDIYIQKNVENILRQEYGY